MNVSPDGWVPVINALLNVVQVCVLAYVAARFRQGPPNSGNTGDASASLGKDK